VKFETPTALWGLASLVLLVLFSLWRQAAAKVIVPSLALWKKIPERNPPVRALRRPKWRFELLLQALAIAAAVGALAGPYRESSELKPRRIAIVIDNSPRMSAADRLQEFKAAAAALVKEKFRGDEITWYAASPSPRKVQDPAEIRIADHPVELEPLLAGARAGADHVLLFSDRPVDGAKLILRAAPADNVGIVAFTAADDEVFIRIVNYGAPRPVPVELSAGDLKVRDAIPAGRTVWSRRGDFSKAASVKVSLGVTDSFPRDDAVEAVRLAEPTTTVSVAGLLHPQILKAIRAVPGVLLRSGEGPARVAVGIDAPPGPGDLRIRLIPAPGRLSGEPVVANHPLMADLDKRGKELAQVFGELPPADRVGRPLLTIGGKVAAAANGNDVRLCVDVAEWGNSLPSLPIFFANVVDVARGGASKLTLSPSNLLDERESDTAGIRRDLDWDPASPTGREPRRTGYGGMAAGAALGLLLLAWLMQLRGE
jgi:hypothetical protein